MPRCWARKWRKACGPWRWPAWASARRCCRWGQTTLVLVEAGPDAAESSPLRQMLQTRGEGVLGLALAGVAGTAVKALPRGQTHGAAFDIVPG
jgi:hypothetical protein